MRKLTALIVMMAMLLSLGAVAAQALYSEREPAILDDWESTISYVTIEAESSCPVSVTDEYPLAYLRFVPEITGYYAFYSTGDCDTYGGLYDAHGYELITDDDSDGTNFCLIYELDAGETYFFMARTYGFVAGDFSVTLNYYQETVESAPGGEVEPEGEDYMAGALPLGQTHSVTITPHTSAYVFTFIPDESGEYVFYSTHNNDVDCYGAILDESGDIVAENDDSGEGLNFAVRYYMTAGRTYYLRAYSLGRDEGSYHAGLERAEDYRGEEEYNTVESVDTEIVADHVQLYETVHIEADNGNVRYTLVFTPQTSGEYVFSSQGDEDVYGYVAHTSGYVLSENDDSGEGLNFAVLVYLEEGETYFLQVRTLSPDGGSFNVNIVPYEDYDGELEYHTGLVTTATPSHGDDPDDEVVTRPSQGGDDPDDGVIVGPGIKPPLGNNGHVHTFGAWNVISAATCTAGGMATRTCTTCEFVAQETFPATGHTFVLREQNDGSKAYVCSVCNETKPAEGGNVETETAAAPANMLGCQSVIASASVLALVTLTAGVVICKKRED